MVGGLKFKHNRVEKWIRGRVADFVLFYCMILVSSVLLLISVKKIKHFCLNNIFFNSLNELIAYVSILNPISISM